MLSRALMLLHTFMYSHTPELVEALELSVVAREFSIVSIVECVLNDVKEGCLWHSELR